MSFRAPDDEQTLEAALAFLDDYDAPDAELFADASAGALRPLEPDNEPTTEPTTAPPLANKLTVSNAPAPSETAKTGPKRVRKRQKDELIYLRCRVSELEERLSRLQKKSRTSADAPTSPALSNMSSTSGSSGADDENASPSTYAAAKPSPTPPASAQLAAVWEKVAARQYEQRQQAEIENAKLKEMLEEQIRVARSLERVLRRRANGDLLNSKKPAKKFTWNRVATKEEEATIFQSMLTELEQQYSEAPQVFSSARFPPSRGAIFRDITVRMPNEDPANQPGEHDMGEMYIDVLDSKILPFDLHSTAAAFWQHMTRGKSVMKSLFREDFELTDDTMARSFGVEISAGPMRGEFRGKQCVRRYQEQDRTVIVWNMLSEPLEISGMFMGGLLMRQKVWIELTPSAEDPTQATQMRARYMMTPDVYDDEATDQERKVGAVTDFVIHSTHGMLNSSHQMIENILVQSMLEKSASNGQ